MDEIDKTFLALKKVPVDELYIPSGCNGIELAIVLRKQGWLVAEFFIQGIEEEHKEVDSLSIEELEESKALRELQELEVLTHKARAGLRKVRKFKRLLAKNKSKNLKNVRRRNNGRT